MVMKETYKLKYVVYHMSLTKRLGIFHFKYCFWPHDWVNQGPEQGLFGFGHWWLQWNTTLKVWEQNSVSHSVMSDSLRTPWTVAGQALLSMKFSSKNTAEGCKDNLKKAPNMHLRKKGFIRTGQMAWWEKTHRAFGIFWLKIWECSVEEIAFPWKMGYQCFLVNFCHHPAGDLRQTVYLSGPQFPLLSRSSSSLRVLLYAKVLDSLGTHNSSLLWLKC